MVSLALLFPLQGSAMEPWKQGCHFDAGGALGQIWWREIQSRGYQLWDLGLGHSIQREQLGGSEESHSFRVCLSKARSFTWLVWAPWLLEKNLDLWTATFQKYKLFVWQFAFQFFFASRLCGKRASFRCGLCKEKRYCSSGCQKNDWLRHQKDTWKA